MPSRNNPIFWLLAFSTLFIIYGSLIPFEFVPPGQPLNILIKNFFANYESRILISKMDILSNFLLYLPFGFFLTAFFIQLRMGKISAVILATALSFVLSLTIEIIQTFFPSRVSSLVDLLVNGIGGGLGAFGAGLFFRKSYHQLQEVWTDLYQEKPLILLTAGLAIAIMIGALAPFDISIQISDIKSAIKNINWIPFLGTNNFNDISSMVIDLVLFGFLSSFCFLAIRLHGFPRLISGFFTLCLVILFASLIEFLQLFSRGRVTDITDIAIALISGCAGIFVGSQIEGRFHHAWIQPRNTPEKSTPATYLGLFGLILYMIFLSYSLLIPFDFNFSWEMAKEHATWRLFIPLYAYWSKFNLFAFQDLFFTVLLYTPLGALFYFCLYTIPFSRFFALIFSLFFASAIEIIQIFQPSRIPDITDVLSAGVGAAIGIWIVGKIKIRMSKSV